MAAREKLTDLLLAAAVEASPTGKEQAAFGRLVNVMDAMGAKELTIQTSLLGGMIDGLVHNNWPEPPTVEEIRKSNRLMRKQG